MNHERKIVSGIAYCIGCACHDHEACEGGCHWLRVDYAAARGVCSECRTEVTRWDAGDRDLRVPIGDSLMVIGQALHAAWHESTKGAEAAAYVAGMIDVLHWLGELSEVDRVGMFEFLGSHTPVPGVPGWIESQ